MGKRERGAGAAPLGPSASSLMRTLSGLAPPDGARYGDAMSTAADVVLSDILRRLRIYVAGTSRRGIGTFVYEAVRRLANGDRAIIGQVLDALDLVVGDLGFGCPATFRETATRAQAMSAVDLLRVRLLDERQDDGGHRADQRAETTS